MTDTAAIDENAGVAKTPDTGSQAPDTAAQDPEKVPELAIDAPVDGPNSAAVTGSTIPAEELERLTGDIVAALKTVYDPEIPADIYEIGLIYKVDI
ncbi:MAG: iron-sulfur cluster assembly protein, partial [Alphaproteobacteria bacterium]